MKIRDIAGYAAVGSMPVVLAAPFLPEMIAAIGLTIFTIGAVLIFILPDEREDIG